MATLPGNLDRKTHPVEHSDQQMQNQSFDRDFNLLARLMAAYDSVSDTVKRVCCDSLGRLCVIINGVTPVTSVLEHSTVSTIAANALTTILTHTVTTNDLLVDKIIATGQVDAEYRIVINSTNKIIYCTAEQDRTLKIDFPIPQKLAVGDIIDIKVIHFYDGVDRALFTSDFSASLIGHKDV